MLKIHKVALVRRSSIKVGVLKTFRKFHRQTLVLDSLFNKVAGLQVGNFKTNYNTSVCL